MEDIWLTRPDLAERWKMPVATLNQWAMVGRGPRFAKFGRHCRYRLSDVIAWENAQFTGVAAENEQFADEPPPPAAAWENAQLAEKAAITP